MTTTDLARPNRCSLCDRKNHREMINPMVDDDVVDSEHVILIQRILRLDNKIIKHAIVRGRKGGNRTQYHIIIYTNYTPDISYTAYVFTPVH